MCRMQCVLALVALHVGLAHSFTWDFVTASEGKLDFYFNGRYTHSENITWGFIMDMTYDAVGDRLFYNTRDAIFSYDISQKNESLLLKNARTGAEKSIVGIAFDPVQELLFWSDMFSNKIYSFSIKPGFENNGYGNLIIHEPNTERKNTLLSALAVDSCRGYIYWTSTNVNQDQVPSTIERARFDGSDREVLIESNLRMPFILVLDQKTQKLYWVGSTRGDTSHDEQFVIESADLNGKNKTILYSETGIDQPLTLDVSKDYIYYMQKIQTVNQLSKIPSIHAKPKKISIGAWYTMAIATNYKIDDQIRGIQGCEGLKRLLPNNSVTDDNVLLNNSSDASLFCVHGMKVSGKSQCECIYGYTGERCDVSVCQNYCVQGDCIVSAEEQPTCSCKAGYSGDRCQVNDCHGYCLNDGICSLNEEGKPVCQCKGNNEGERCDVSNCKCFQKVVSMMWRIMNADERQAARYNGVKSTCALSAV